MGVVSMGKAAADGGGTTILTARPSAVVGAEWTRTPGGPPRTAARLAGDQFSSHNQSMSTLTLNLAEAKARLSELTERVTHGDEVVITRHGKPVARIQQVRDKARRVDVAAFRRATAEQAEQAPAEALIRELRDSARY